MTTTAASLRALFPEFASTATFPDAAINAWLAVAVGFVNADRWGANTDFGVALWTAHQLAIGRRNAVTAGNGGAPGTSLGVLTSKSAGGVSAGYDFSSVSEKDAGFWNQTSYGIQFYRLSQQFGMGPLQVGTDGGSGVIAGVWPGPVW